MQNLGAGIVTLLAACFPMEGQVTLGAIMTLMVLLVVLSFSWLRHHGSPHEQMAV
jgi:DHA1 family 2-module integral membrane pump EmrD-like MFS transporter